MGDDNPIAVPYPAASVLVIREEKARLEVLMIERAKTMKFAPGAFVFPGGKVDKADSDSAVWHGLTNANEDLPDFAFRVAALRELYEEAGLLLTTGGCGAINTQQTFREEIRAQSALLDLTAMTPFAHWVTPEGMPRRFDTLFFLVAHNGQDVRHDGNEAISYRWVSPKETLFEWDENRIPLMFPTRLNLMKLARAASVDEALEQAKESTVIRTLPVIGRDANGVKLTIDAASGYEVTRASDKELRVESPK